MLTKRQKSLIRALMYPVQFDSNPSGSVGRVLQYVVRNRSLNANEEEYASAVQSALGGDEKVSALMPETQDESVIRNYLSQVHASLAVEQAEQDSDRKVFPVIEEVVEVGKRQLQRGGVRVFSHVVETPVEEDVQLREEHVRVERVPVNRPASEADFDTFKEGTVEITAMGEEVVVGKQVRVVEEIKVGKDVSERTQKVQDAVRHTEVDVEEVAKIEVQDKTSKA